MGTPRRNGAASSVSGAGRPETLVAGELDPIAVRRISVDEGETLRRLRLAALDDLPGDFASTPAGTRGLTDERWDEIAAANASGANQAIWFAYAGEQPAGMLAAYRTLDDVVTLTSMWAAPDFRRMGVAEALVEAATAWAALAAARQLRLWVRADNESARRFYLELGFAATGATMTYELDPRQVEVEFRRGL